MHTEKKITPVGTYPYRIDAYLTDFRGKATLPMIGGFMLQAATRHAEERGFGYSAMTRKKRAWVLTRLAIEMREYPKNDTDINLRTWILDANKLFTERCFSIEDSSGRELGFARSVWASIDLETRRPANVLELDGLVEYKHDKECPMGNAVKIPQLKESDVLGSFKVQYSDIDINKHLNSMKYIEHFVDVFPIELFVEKEISLFEINYLHEGRYGTQLNVMGKETTESVYQLEMKEPDRVICAARVTWR
ncbi:medium-chain acyl-[acyl-carrier-protein] hydrolase [Dysgonomonas sp. PH5-45]|uniref:acyl-[acyl-carrier-protein] thioesterase n=1 Tax=unclassified Dysgonomonas TaxID=2630389 RepID=UPI002472EC8C|nr:MULTISPECIES: acyl-ACP thioesterase domain-containing protein [unclassified Dysgonomonas]MDH6355512.1 medium-chain acyl-[acyl-carrier-protein] hydrolase [Dysgonomonas sp. PH5-45]MDH6388427.1 medium-chain acyl-[acyl-carrier-protein] hydrolase [Dysgonomonas sp. PH5-37]